MRFSGLEGVVKKLEAEPTRNSESEMEYLFQLYRKLERASPCPGERRTHLSTVCRL